MVKRFVIGVFCVMAAGCGATTPATEIGPSAIAPLASSGGETTDRLSAQSIGSCPDGNAPSWLQTWTHGSTARLRWTEVAPGVDYHVIIERYDVTNRYVPVENGDVWTRSATFVELTLSEGRYRAKVQTMSCGKFMGPWSEVLQFSVEGTDAPASGDPEVAIESGTPPLPAPPVPTPPVPTPPVPTPPVPTPPVPEPPSSESAEGTKVAAPGGSLTDASGAVWTFGSQVVGAFYEVLRNGVYMSGWGSYLKYHNHSVYHLGTDGNWYRWNGSGWTNAGSTEP